MDGLNYTEREIENLVTDPSSICAISIPMLARDWLAMYRALDHWKNTLKRFGQEYDPKTGAAPARVVDELHKCEDVMLGFVTEKSAD